MFHFSENKPSKGKLSGSKADWKAPNQSFQVDYSNPNTAQSKLRTLTTTSKKGKVHLKKL